MNHVKEALLKASSQLPTDSPTLVAIVDDLFWSPADDVPANVLVPTLESFFKSNVGNVGGVLFLNPVHFLSRVEVSLRARFVPNNSCQRNSRSEDLERALRRFISEDTVISRSGTRSGR